MSPRSFPIRFGVQPWQQNCTWPEYARCVREIEDLGFDTCLNMDHVLSVGAHVDGPCFEAYTCLAAMAAQTERVRIGALVTGNSYRYPGMLAKAATTVDHVSAGRLILGFGAGWAEREHTMYAIPFPKVPERLGRMAEAIDLIKLLWTQDRTSYSGKYYQVRDALFEPKPVQRPHPPILIGGMGEQVTLKVAAKHADIWNGGGSMPVSVLRRKLDILAQHCKAVGRSPDEIVVSMQISLWMDDRARAEEDAGRWAARHKCSVEEAKTGMLIGTSDDVVQQIKTLAREGVTDFVVPLPNPNDRTTVRRFARDVIPAFRSSRSRS